MGKSARAGLAKKEESRKDWPVVVYLWMFALGAFGYLVVGEFALMTKPHPLHWAAALGGAALGLPVGWLWYRWRGDI